MSQGEKYVGLKIDIVGEIGTRLRDLKGITTLVNELIQNADDAPDANEIEFDFCQDALNVYNNGTFRDEDFERLSTIASGGKRDEEGTTGAFGVGFISVYQVTDAPEIIASGRHWTIRPDEAAGQEIVERGVHDTTGTRIRLPWAVNAESSLRKRLRAESVNLNKIPSWVEEVKEHLQSAILFLKRIKKINLCRSGQLQYSITRTVEGSQIIIKDTFQSRTWHTFKGSYKEQELEMRKVYPNEIEAKRNSNVMIAFCKTVDTAGALYSCLPTGRKLALPFHVNADFYPRSDRKDIVLEKDYQGKWNMAALECAAGILADNLLEIRDLLGHVGFWELIREADKLNRESGNGIFGAFWRCIVPALKSEAIVYTEDCNWACAREVRFWDSNNKNSRQLLCNAGLSLVHRDLRPFHNLLISNVVNVKRLIINDITNLLQEEGLLQPTTLEDMPSWLSPQLDIFWRLCNELMTKRMAENELKIAKDELAACAIAPGGNDIFYPANSLYRADLETEELFCSFTKQQFLTSWSESSDILFAKLSPEFTVNTAIELLAKETYFVDGKIDKSIKILRWFDKRIKHIDEPLRSQLLETLMAPSASGELRPLKELSIPGGFREPLKLAEFIDTVRCGGTIEFLKLLGVQELNAINYIRNHLCPKLEDGIQLSPDQHREIINFLAQNIVILKVNSEIRGRLGSMPIIECLDNKFRSANKTYFDSKVIRLILGDTTNIVKLNRPDSIVFDLYKWLGVTNQLRPDDVLDKIQDVVSHPPTRVSIETIEAIVDYLSDILDNNKFVENVWWKLKEISWLPAQGVDHKWFKPNQLFATYQKYLFSSQGSFINISQKAQNKAAKAKLFKYLGVKINPTTELVVKHLLYCSGTNELVNNEVYSFLNRNYSDPAIEQLKGTPCLMLGRQYLKPDQVFWDEHDFGPLRKRLGANLRKYQDLFTRLGVKDKPDNTDAIKILLEVSENVGSRSMDKHNRQINMNAWRLLTKKLNDMDEGSLDCLRHHRVIPDRQGYLTYANFVYFDEREVLRIDFEKIKNNLIDKIHGVWKAMAVAGVRSLSEIAHVQMLGLNSKKPDLELKNDLYEKRNQIARCLNYSAEKAEGCLEESFEKIQALQVCCVGSILLRWTIKLGSQIFKEDNRVLAHYCKREHVLYYCIEGNSKPWSSIARAISTSLDVGDDNIGFVASGISDVLKAGSVREAERLLNELGFPVLSIFAKTTHHSETLSDLGQKDNRQDLFSSGGEWVDTGEDPSETSRKGTDSKLDTGIDKNDKIRKLVEIREGGCLEDSAMDTNRTGGTTPDSSRANRQQRQQQRLISYVSGPRDDTMPDDTNLEGSEQRRLIGDAAVKAVIDYELRNGRNAKSMDHTNRGYDVLSGSDGEKRYIEVKGTEGVWGERGITLTPAQFNFKKENPELDFWLYVVENVFIDPRIYMIQNPSSKVDRFAFDSGWKQVAERDEI